MQFFNIFFVQLFFFKFAYFFEIYYGQLEVFFNFFGYSNEQLQFNHGSHFNIIPDEGSVCCLSVVLVFDF